ncbi:MAG: type I methionyl aminopeptidase [Roseiflexaceae bacterium]
MVILHTAADIAAMRKAGQLVAKTFAHIMPLVVPGVSTHTLDEAAERYIRANGATPAYKGYLGFPATICVAPNSVICHGIPSASDILREGDIVGLDIGVILDGWYGDACITVPVGTISVAAQQLLDVTAECLRRGIAAATVGNTLGDIGAAIQHYAESHGYSVVREYTGHGVGQRLHQEPTVHHVGKAGSGLALKEGMIFTIEPMINAGSHKTTLDKKDKWTVRTADGKLSAQFEHTIAISADGPQILTLP